MNNQQNVVSSGMSTRFCEERSRWSKDHIALNSILASWMILHHSARFEIEIFDLISRYCSLNVLLKVRLSFSPCCSRILCGEIKTSARDQHTLQDFLGVFEAFARCVKNPVAKMAAPQGAARISAGKSRGAPARRGDPRLGRVGDDLRQITKL